MLKYKYIIFDLDGTIYFGSQLANKANDVISKARNISKNIFFVTNNSAKSREQIFQRLKNLGVDLKIEELYTVSYVMPKYLLNHNLLEVYCVGTKDLRSELEKLGINPVSHNPQAIVVGFNPEFKLSDLDELANINLNKDYKLIIANKERTYPVDNGYKNAGAGPIVGAVEGLLEHKFDIMVGKPNVELLKTVISDLEIKPNEVCIIGDSYYSDIKMGKEYGADTILISKEQHQDCVCIENLSDLLEIWND